MVEGRVWYLGLLCWGVGSGGRGVLKVQRKGSKDASYYKRLRFESLRAWGSRELRTLRAE